MVEMSGIDPVVKRETRYIAFWVLIFSVIMEAVFLAIGKWNLTVLFGNILGAAGTIANFFLMALTVQKSLDMDEKDAANNMKLSHTLRNIMIIAVVVLGFVLPFTSPWSTVIPLFFTRIAVALRPLMDRKKNGGQE